MRRSKALMGMTLVLAACAAGSPEAVPEPLNPTDPGDTSPGVAPAGEQDASATRVLDGDTFELELGGDVVEVRLLGINTPERDECHGSESRTRALELVDGARISVTGNEYDQFGRLLAYVYADDTVVNAELVASGMALAQSNEHPRRQEFKDLEEQAFRAGIGLWNPLACPPSAEGNLVIADLVADAPGPDNENPNGEFVIVENVGDNTVNLAGWTIRDESSRHRYTFGDFSLESGDSVTVYSGNGNDTNRELYWAASDPVWSNGGDTAYLLDPSGNYHSRRAHVR